MALFNHDETGKRLQVAKTVQEKALDSAGEALDIILHVMRTGEKDSTRLAAAKDVLKIALGKEVTADDVLETGRKTKKAMTADEAERMVS
jgi:hypothetical protein